jgi:alginate O-acetyltransferase complex protein AlgI
MLFSSPTFFAFFAGYFALHLVAPPRFRIFLIIVGSTVFYAWWKLEYIWLPYLLTAIAYGGVLWIEHEKEPALRKRRLIFTIVALFAPLAFFKYTDFVYGDVLGPVFGFSGKLLDLPLPLGVSFVTFTLTAYVVDIYQGRFPRPQSAATTTGYVLFFPHLIAGPILRPIELIPQLEHPRRALDARFAIGFLIFTAGLVKKLVFADQIAAIVDAIYAADATPSGPAALLAIYGFSMQIYCDFSGYTDMAIGLALIIGVRLPNNFLRPYGATSVVDFWRRWHITLSFWLRDYLYIPLGGNRKGRLRTYVNLIITMVLGGLWHGANWTFVIWGFLHGVGISMVHLARNVLAKGRPLPIPRFLCVLLTFHFVTILWVFFRAPDLGKALQMLSAPIVGSWAEAANYAAANTSSLMLLATFGILHPFDDHRRIKLAARRVRPELIWPLVVLLWILAMTLSHGSSGKFIYFDF